LDVTNDLIGFQICTTHGPFSSDSCWSLIGCLPESSVPWSWVVCDRCLPHDLASCGL